MGKRLLASFLAAAMMLTMAPVAFAIENTEDTIDADQIPATEEAVAGENQIETKDTSTLQSAIDAANGSYTLTEDTTADITINKDLVLDLGCHTLTNTNAGKATITVANGAAVTVKNGFVVGGKSFYNIQVAAGGTLTLEGVTATAGNNDSSMIDNIGTLTITSGTYTGGLNVVKSEPNATLTITGGTFNLESAVAWDYTGVVMNYGDAIITGGTFNQNATTPYKAYPTVVITAKENEEEPRPTTKITGGTFVNKHTNNGAKIFHNMKKAYQSDFDVSGGTFSKKVAAAYCPNYIVEKDSTTGMYSIGAKAVAVQVKAGSDYVYENYANIAQAVKKASKNYTVKLLQNVTEDINIPASKVVNLDLNGHTLTNASGDTITVAAKGTLTIKGEGTVDNVTHAKAAIVNNGTVTLNGGTYTRSKENPENNKDDGGGNSYYTILNDKGGNMTINSGVTVTNAGHFSSMIRNGGDENSTAKSVLTINGGTFSGGINTIKNDAYGILTINDGNFSNTSQFVVMNWNDATINGGTFSVNKSAQAVLFSAEYDKNCAVGELTITGGTFKGTGNQTMIDTYYSAEYIGTASVSGGVFTADVTKFCAPGYKTELTNGVYVVKAGTNDAINAIDKAIKADATKDDIKAAVDAVVSTPNATLANSSTTMDKLAKLEEKITNAQITVETHSTVADVAAPAATNAKLSAEPAATGEQKITIDVASSTASTEAATTLVGEGAKSATAMDITMKLNNQPIEPKAPVVLTFDLPSGWANAQIVYMNGTTPELVKTSVSTDTNGKATISGTFNHFSTYILVQTAATANPNAYTLTLEPNVNDVAAGDTIKYTVKLTHTSGNTNDKVARLIFNPVVDDEILELDTTQSVGAQGVTFAKDGDGKYQFTFQSNVDLANGDSMNIGTLAYTAKAYAKTTAINVSGDEETRVTNATGYQEGAPVTVETPTNVTYHVTTVTFKNADGSSTTFYVPYEGNGTQFYNDLDDLYERTSAQAIPQAVDGSVTNGTQYRLKYNGTNDSNSDNWYLSTDSNKGKYSSTTSYSVDTTYEVNRVKLLELTLPKTPTVKLDDTVTTTVKDGKTYVDESADLIFTIDGTPSAGKKFDVTVKDGGTKVDGVTNSNSTWTAPGTNLTTGPVEIKVEEVLALTADDIGIFEVTLDGDVKGYQPFSTYSGNKTLVLIKGDSSAKYSLTGGPEIYALLDKAYINKSDESYTHAVLIDPTNVDFGKDEMLAHLTDDLQLKAESGENTTISYDWDTNGLSGPKLDDVQATFDFKSLKDNELKWKPTDEMLLKADVMNLADGGNVYDNSSYKTQRDGVVTDNDVYAFMYLYTRIAGGNTN